jgi:hypothetical protein
MANLNVWYVTPYLVFMSNATPQSEGGADEFDALLRARWLPKGNY